MGDARLQALTLEDIGAILTQLGRTDEAISVYGQIAELGRQLQDPDIEANTLYRRAKACMEGQRWQETEQVLSDLTAAHTLLNQIERLDGICMVCLHLGQLHGLGGNTEHGLSLLQRSWQGFLKLGQTQYAEYVAGLIEQFSANRGASSAAEPETGNPS